MQFLKRVRKPVQTGIKVSITCVMRFVEKLQRIPIKYILIINFTQNVMENLFSQIRRQDVSHPQAVQFRKLCAFVCLGQFIMVQASSSYEEDDTP